MPQTGLGRVVQDLTGRWHTGDSILDEAAVGLARSVHDSDFDHRADARLARLLFSEVRDRLQRETADAAE